MDKEVKYKAVPEYVLCEGCINRDTEGYKQNGCVDFVDRMIKNGLPNCNDESVIYIQDTNNKLTIEEVREKFEIYLYHDCIPTIRNTFPKDCRGKYKFTDDQKKWEAYKQALKDFGYEIEGE